MKIRFKQDRRTILQILKSANMKRKIRVLDKMNGVNERDSINILLKVLEDESWILREKAAHKITQYGSRVVGRLERLLIRGYWYTRAAACLALGEIGNARSIPAIVDVLLRDDNPTVIKEASRALVRIAQNHPEAYTEAFHDLNVSKPDHDRIRESIHAAMKNQHRPGNDNE
ncbi:HEAT repeat domain-containing protein [candidate division WOR-3 bacterium]|nr:HEAT repeat domain-containing protein [candidate division WOR-3 bacterium]